ncbi:ribosome recycling factor [Candidatus Uhrbacteria bacterium]|nr:ribosome recycling factor [Candidatus Uhrbacteria bacterium]
MANPIEIAKPEFEQTIDHFGKELHNIRSGRAHASMVEHLLVDAYGSAMELKGVASISVPDAKTIQIEPWDKTLVKEIEKAIQAAGIGVNPVTAGTVIRLNLPPLTEENRKTIVKIVHQKAEQARIGIRKIRENVRETISADMEAKRISEDEKFRLQDSLDNVVTEYNGRIEAMAAEKEKDVMTI